MLFISKFDIFRVQISSWKTSSHVHLWLVWAYMRYFDALYTFPHHFLSLYTTFLSSLDTLSLQLIPPIWTSTLPYACCDISILSFGFIMYLMFTKMNYWILHIEDGFVEAYFTPILIKLYCCQMIFQHYFSKFHLFLILVES